MENLPDYSGSAYVELNGNQPDFDENQFNTQSYEFYTQLDQLGRCGACYADIGQDLMPTEKRESISSVPLRVDAGSVRLCGGEKSL